MPQTFTVNYTLDNATKLEVYLGLYYGARVKLYMVFSQCTTIGAGKSEECIAAIDLASMCGLFNPRSGDGGSTLMEDLSYIRRMIGDGGIVDAYLRYRINNKLNSASTVIAPQCIPWGCASSPVPSAASILNPDKIKNAAQLEWFRCLASDGSTKELIIGLTPLLQEVDSRMASVFNGSDFRFLILRGIFEGRVLVDVYGDSVSGGASKSKSLVNPSLVQLWYMLSDNDMKRYRGDAIAKVYDKHDAQYVRSVNKSVIIGAVNDEMARLQATPEGSGVPINLEGARNLANRALTNVTFSIMAPGGVQDHVRVARMLLRCVGATSNLRPLGEFPDQISSKIDLYQYVRAGRSGALSGGGSDGYDGDVEPAAAGGGGIQAEEIVDDEINVVGPFKEFIQRLYTSLDVPLGSAEYSLYNSNVTIQNTGSSIIFYDSSGRRVCKFTARFRFPPNPGDAITPVGKMYRMPDTAGFSSCRCDGELVDVYSLGLIVSESVNVTVAE